MLDNNKERKLKVSLLSAVQDRVPAFAHTAGDVGERTCSLLPTGRPLVHRGSLTRLHALVQDSSTGRLLQEVNEEVHGDLRLSISVHTSVYKDEYSGAASVP